MGPQMGAKTGQLEAGLGKTVTTVTNSVVWPQKPLPPVGSTEANRAQ